MYSVILFTQDTNQFSIAVRDVSKPSGVSTVQAIVRKEASRGFAATTVAQNLTEQQAHLLRSNLSASLTLAGCTYANREHLSKGPVYA